MTAILPKIPSKLLFIGLADLRKCEEDERYDINMTFWHNPKEDVCVVCLAGAVMAQTLGVPIDEYAEPDVGVNANQLFALNFLRGAESPECMKHACELLGATPIEWTTPIPPYHRDREGFHREMTALAHAFEESGQ